MKSKVAILIAIAVGLVAIIAIQRFISGSLGAKEGGAVKVLTARHALKKGTMFSMNDCSVVEVPASYYTRMRYSFIREEEAGNYTQKKLTMDYPTDAYLSSLTFVENTSQTGLDVPPGQCAVAIGVDERSSVGGSVKRDDYVDIIMVQRVNRPMWDAGGGAGGPGGGPGGQMAVTEPLLVSIYRHVRVLAAGHSSSSTDIEDIGRGGYSTVTVQLPSDKADVVGVQGTQLQFTLKLLSPNDPPGEDLKPTLVRDTTQLLEVLSGKAAKTPAAPGGGAGSPGGGAGTSPSSGDSTSPPTRTYMNKDFNVGFDPPAGWTARTSTLQGVLVDYAAPEVVDNFRAGINLGTLMLEKDMTSKECMNLTIETFQKNLPEFKIIDASEVQTDAGVAAKLVYTAKMYGIVGKAQQVFLTTSGKKAVYITCTATLTSFDQYKDQFEACCKTLWMGK
jgi:Flp pilus assembly protein CpaB